MKRHIIILLLAITVAYAQKKSVHSNQQLQCSTCHECEVPTKNNPCLRQCIRESLVSVKHSADEAPAVITIDRFKKIEDHYMPVIFSHQAHAEMSNLSGGCVTCHHYNPPGQILSCVDCHETSRKRDDIMKPDLKGAYHRQCIDCHSKWSHEYECLSCHEPNNGNKKVSSGKKKTTPITVHKKINEPEKLVYETKYKNGPKVTFLHTEHTKLFNLDCTSCHSNESCVKCHDRAKEKSPKVMKDSDPHAKCSSCHEVKKDCSFCHSEKEKPGFSHLTRTGWELNKFHKKLSCIDCHETKGKFEKLPNDCNSCHPNWSTENFNHKITGLELDEIHIESECSDCHIDGNYSKHSCENCHDEEFKYPEYLPGKKVK